MTRETKVGIGVACSFLCLVGVVLTLKLREGGQPATDMTEMPAFAPPTPLPPEPAAAATVASGQSLTPVSSLPPLEQPPTGGSGLRLTSGAMAPGTPSVTSSAVPSTLPAQVEDHPPPTPPLPPTLRETAGPLPESGPPELPPEPVHAATTETPSRASNLTLPEAPPAAPPPTTVPSTAVSPAPVPGPSTPPVSLGTPEAAALRPAGSQPGVMPTRPGLTPLAADTMPEPTGTGPAPVPPPAATMPTTPPAATTVPIPASLTPAAPGATAPGALAAAPATNPTTLPPLGAPTGAATPPVTAPVPLPPLPVTTGPKVEAFDEQTYRCQPADTLAGICDKLYHDPKYEKALLMFNRNHIMAAEGIKSDPPQIQPNQPIYVPPAKILEKRYANLIPGLTPLPPPGPAPAPLPGSSGTVATSFTNPPAGERPYQVANPNGEMMYDIAQRTLGKGDRWIEIRNMNPSLRPEQPVPAGTVLRLPGQ